MKNKRLIYIAICVILLCATISVFGQEYPKKMIINKDTVVVLSFSDVAKINVAYSIIERDSELIVLQNTKINGLNTVISSQDDVISKQKSEINLLSKMNDDKNMTIFDKDTIIKKQNNKDKRKNKIISVESSIILLLSLILIL